MFLVSETNTSVAAADRNPEALMNRTSIALAALFATAGLALTLAPDASVMTTSGAAHSAIALPTGRGGGSGGGGGGGGSGGSGGSGGGHGGGGQYNATIASVDKDAQRERRRRIRPGQEERTYDGCSSGYYDGAYGCYQPQA
jgi:hypothetical protein